MQHIPDFDEMVDGIAFANSYNVSLASCRLGHLTLENIYATHHDVRPSNLMVVSTQMGELLAKRETEVLRVVPITQRLDITQSPVNHEFIDGLPKKSQIKRSMHLEQSRELTSEHGARSSGSLLHLPRDAKNT